MSIAKLPPTQHRIIMMLGEGNEMRYYKNDGFFKWSKEGLGFIFTSTANSVGNAGYIVKGFNGTVTLTESGKQYFEQFKNQ